MNNLEKISWIVTQAYFTHNIIKRKDLNTSGITYIHDLKRILIEGKMLIDRYNYITQTFILPSVLEQYVLIDIGKCLWVLIYILLIWIKSVLVLRLDFH